MLWFAVTFLPAPALLVVLSSSLLWCRYGPRRENVHRHFRQQHPGQFGTIVARILLAALDPHCLKAIAHWPMLSNLLLECRPKVRKFDRVTSQNVHKRTVFLLQPECWRRMRKCDILFFIYSVHNLHLPISYPPRKLSSQGPQPHADCPGWPVLPTFSQAGPCKRKRSFTPASK